MCLGPILAPTHKNTPPPPKIHSDTKKISAGNSTPDYPTYQSQSSQEPAVEPNCTPPPLPLRKLCSEPHDEPSDKRRTNE